MFMPAVDGEEYIELIDKAIKSNRPVNELKDAPAHLQDKTINW